YVPLETSYPAERLAFMLADARIEVVITESRLLVAGRWPLVESAQVSGVQVSSGQPSAIGHLPSAIVRLDTDWPSISQSPISKPQSAILPPNIAYLIYTSGSTGQPKGV